MKHILTLIMILSLNQFFGQHIIEKQRDACLDSVENQTTYGMVGCIEKATKKWKIEMDKNYQKLMGLLSKSQKENLKASQKLWFEYRNKETIFSNKLYDDLDGTMWLPIAAEERYNLMKARANRLSNYISELEIE